MHTSEHGNHIKRKTGRRALKTPVHGDCQVCGQPGHGSHFGVLACRACAAFFRRTVVMNRQYTCRRANGSCQISKDERYLCRLCRFNKCLALGMTPDNVQWNRDVLSTTVEGRKQSAKRLARTMVDTPNDLDDGNDYVPQGELNQQANCSFEDCIRPSPIIPESKPPLNEDPFMSYSMSSDSCASGNQLQPIRTPAKRHIFDISHIMTKLRGILSDFQPTDANIPNEPLKRMHYALLRHRRSQQRAVDLKVVETLSVVDMWSFWEAQLYALAEWMMHCKEFAALPLEEKVILFKNSWMLWQRFERITMSIELFGWRTVNEKILALTDQIAVNSETMRITDMSCLTDHDPGYIKRMFKPFTGRLTEEVAKSCLEISLNPIEVAYVLCTLIWHVEGKPVSPDTLTVAELYRERISDDLHQFYTDVTITPNYAARLIRIMSIVHNIENIHYERSKVMELARIFDIFKIELSEKGMYC
ncbi:hypothetical protein Q1695_004582 [Nippostrongylus brasiliensis]|nr:hypothetical protein Q1695_004582 [Nippostrongylus brasiliensis]